MTAAEEQTRVACPLCQADDAQLRLHGRDRLFGQPGTYPVVQCRRCSLRYLSPRPSLAALGRHYPDDYFPVRLPGSQPPALRALSRLLMNMRWIKYIQRVERVIGRIPAAAQVVDVGCGLNHLLRRLREVRGCQGLGIDFKPELAAYIRDELRMPVVQGTLEDAALPAGSVDLVTMNEYLEHEPDPRRALLEARRIAKAGAHLVVEVPYCSGLPARLMGSCWSQLDVPRHLVFYTPQTLEEMLRRCGFRLVHVRPFGAPFSFGISVLQALGFKRLGAMRPLDVLLIALTGTALLPLFPVLREFMFAVARAE